MPLRRAYDGRLIFDHLPKTAGQAINAWLVEQLGAGCVSPNLRTSEHRPMIKCYGGEYSVISGHVVFDPSGLDPRYRYVTCLREPMDRAVSWLFFLAKNHEEHEIGNLWGEAVRFLESDGDVLGEQLADSLTNPYVNHFSAISCGDLVSGEAKLGCALDSIAQYDLIGFYEDLPGFLMQLSALIGVKFQAQIGRVNVTRIRPSVAALTPKLKSRLESLTNLDSSFYRTLIQRATKLEVSPDKLESMVSGWTPYVGLAKRKKSLPGFDLLSAMLEGSPEVSRGQPLNFDISFSLEEAISGLFVRILIIDEFERRAFGTNTVALGHPLFQLRQGVHRIRFALVADLPAGSFSVGIYFLHSDSSGETELAGYDALISFTVAVSRPQPSTGYAGLPVEYSHSHISDQPFRVDHQLLFTACGMRQGASLVSQGEEGFLLYGPYASLAAGEYVAAVAGSFLGDLTGAWADVSCARGNRVLARVGHEQISAAGESLFLRFQLDAPVDDLEVRIWVGQGARFRIDSLVIDAVAVLSG
jgi:hypothetical protein